MNETEIELAIGILIIAAILCYFWWRKINKTGNVNKVITTHKYFGFIIKYNEISGFTRVFNKKGKLIRTTFIDDVITIQSYINNVIRNEPI